MWLPLRAVSHLYHDSGIIMIPFPHVRILFPHVEFSDRWWFPHVADRVVSQFRFAQGMYPCLTIWAL